MGKRVGCDSFLFPTSFGIGSCSCPLARFAVIVTKLVGFIVEVISWAKLGGGDFVFLLGFYNFSFTKRANR
jgi:hypothetical protein